jgi:hypothetical protein
MNKIVHIKIFNDLLDQLFNFLETKFPLFKSDLLLTKSTVEFIRNSNPRLVVEQFMAYALPYEKQIYDCDEDFFLNFEKNVSELSGDNLLVGMKIKNVWLSDSITDHQKAYIWLYFQRLLKAGKSVLV